MTVCASDMGKILTCAECVSDLASLTAWHFYIKMSRKLIVFPSFSPLKQNECRAEGVLLYFDVRCFML
jgi:hypothetical protein